MFLLFYLACVQEILSNRKRGVLSFCPQQSQAIALNSVQIYCPVVYTAISVDVSFITIMINFILKLSYTYPIIHHAISAAKFSTSTNIFIFNAFYIMDFIT